MHGTILPFRNPYQPEILEYSPDSEFSNLLSDSLALSSQYPEILFSIAEDQDAWGLRKKQERLVDAEWDRAQSLKKFDPLFESPPREEEVETIRLKRGRPRMPPEAVFLFLILRSYVGGFKNKKNYGLMADSQTLRRYLGSLGINSFPGASTIIENMNAVSVASADLIHRCSLLAAKDLQLDSFSKLYFDSTAIEASSAWPTDSGTIMGLTQRLMNGFSILGENGIKVNFPKGSTDDISTIRNCHVSISLTQGKKGSKKHIKKMYRKILRLLKSLAESFQGGIARASEKIGDILPSLKLRLEGLLEHLEADLHNVVLCGENARRRVLQGQKVPAEEKVLSLSDEDAEMIGKGGRDTVFGFKPQIGRSDQGFIVAATVPQGNASDSGQMTDITNQAIAKTGVIPAVLSYDDGYTNSSAREQYKDQGVEVISFSGAKGKKVTLEEWNLADYQQARNERSKVESTMFELKYKHNLRRFDRRGIAAVRQELLSAAYTHNLLLMRRLTGQPIAA
jgi:hypothetical protein